MTKKVKKTWLRYSMGAQGDLVVVALSGGADSVCLLDVLSELADELGIELAVAHFNHKLRGEASDRDEMFARRLAEEKGLRFFAASGNVLAKAKREGVSVEMAGRALRYEFFEKLAEKLHRDNKREIKIALGHTADDQAETVLMRLLRGAGPRGLAGIPPVRGIFIRPLIETTRQEILKYLKARKKEWVEDETNFLEDYLRNKIRLDVMPALIKNFNPNLVETLVRTANACRDMVEFLDDEGASAARFFKSTKHGITFPRTLLTDKPPAVAVAVVEQALNTFGSGLWAVRSDHRRAILDALKEGKITKITLPFGVEIQLNSQEIVIRKPHRLQPPVFCYPLNPCGVTEIPELSAQIAAEVIKPASAESMSLDVRRFPTIAYLDYDTVQKPLEVRNFRPGDRFQPLGMKKEKKLQDFFVDMKLPREQRMFVPIITADRKIVWVAPYRIAHPHRITPRTTRILKMTLHRLT